MLDTILQRKQMLLAAGLCLLVFVAGIGIGLQFTNAPTETMPEEQNNTESPQQVEFNSSELLTSHQQNLAEQRPYNLTLLTTASTPSKNQSAVIFYSERVQVQQSATYIRTESVSGESTEMWITTNQSLLYNLDTNNVTETNLTNIENRQTRYLFIQQVFSSGEFEYTEVSVTGPSTFELTNFTDKESLLYAYPGMTGQSEGEVTNVTITGTVENGVVTSLSGSFDFQPRPQEYQNNSELNASEDFNQHHFAFELSINTTVEPEQTPRWVQEYNQSQEGESPPSNETDTQS